MAVIISLNTLRAYGPGNTNRDGSGQVKTCTVGGELRVRQSSASIKRAIRDLFTMHFGKKYQTRGVVGLLMDKAEEKGLLTDENRDAMCSAFEILAYSGKDLPKEKDRKYDPKGRLITGQVLSYSEAEIEAVLRFVVEKGADEIVKNGAASCRELADLLKAVSVGAEIAVFGRMTASGIGSTVASATHFNHAYSIDDYAGEFDYFTAIDNYISGAGAGHLDTFSFASNTMYGYMNIDPVQVYENLASELDYQELTDEERASKEHSLKVLAKEAVLEAVRGFLSVHPAGKQNAMASMPVPSAVYATVTRNGFPVTMDNVFNGTVRKYGNTPVSALGAERMCGYILNDEPKQDFTYRAFCMDSTVSGELENGAGEKNLCSLKKLCEEGTVPVYSMNRLDEVIDRIGEEVDAVLGI